MNWSLLSASEQKQALERGELSAETLLESTIQQAEQTQRDINPIAVPLYGEARLAARAADRALRNKRGGPLCGLPVTVKDSQWLAGVPCANGSHSLKDFVPAQTSRAIRRLEAAGAVIFAKTTCPEFCVSGTNNSPLYGPTRNPWHLSYTPGGSSGGAAAAVASGVGSLALGSDGGGSIRIPASFCGVAGFKPSHGLVPRYPGFPTWESLVSYGPLARSVADLRLMMSALTGDGSYLDGNTVPNRGRWKTPRPSTQPDLDKLNLVACADLGFAPVDEDVRGAFNHALERINDGGHTVRRDNPGLRSSVVTWATLATRDMWEHKRGHLDDNAGEEDELGIYAQEFIRFGGGFNEDAIADAQAHCRQILDAYLAMFRRNRATILLTPTMGCEAFPGHRTHPKSIGGTSIELPWLDWAGFLYDANLAGMPACSIPMGIGDEGLPLGLQLIGPPGSDRDLLKAAGIVEALLDWQPSAMPRHSHAPILDGARHGELPSIPTEHHLNNSASGIAANST